MLQKDNTIDIIVTRIQKINHFVTFISHLKYLQLKYSIAQYK